MSSFDHHVFINLDMLRYSGSRKVLSVFVKKLDAAMCRCLKWQKIFSHVIIKYNHELLLLLHMSRYSELIYNQEKYRVFSLDATICQNLKWQKIFSHIIIKYNHELLLSSCLYQFGYAEIFRIDVRLKNVSSVFVRKLDAIMC